MPRQTTIVTTKQEVTIAPKLIKKLLTELHGYGAIAAEMKALKGGKEDHSAKVLELSLAGVDGDKYELEGYKVAVVKGAKNNKLNVAKLMKRVVGDGKYSVKAFTAVLEDCTDETPKKDHVRITPPGEKDDE